MHGEEGVQPLWRRRPHLLPVPKVRQTQNLRICSCRNTSPNDHQTKAGPYCQRQGERIPEGFYGRSLEQTRANQEKQPEGTGPTGSEIPKTRPRGENANTHSGTKHSGGSGSPTRGFSLSGTHPPQRNSREESANRRTSTGGPGEPEQMQAAGAEEGKESTATTRTQPPPKPPQK
ncbi:hypothetical protein NDU88_007835 [Pleurodeles waltl]|uniref:Uncharacterized protein n=1 Tax=Pleurodeles waltl TaxID=8319 RepID=A0AAV7STM1_PLEWA|nr:hypothetical protein NDU88_007835 [Pleurodeles waltl]